MVYFDLGERGGYLQLCSLSEMRDVVTFCRPAGADCRCRDKDVDSVSALFNNDEERSPLTSCSPAASLLSLFITTLSKHEEEER